MSDQTVKHAWHIQGLMDVNKVLDVSPVGSQERDDAHYSEEENRERRRQRMLRGARFEKMESIVIDDIGGPTWSVRRLNPKNKDPLPAMNLGGKPVVTPECRAVLEQADLGAVDFHRIEVLDINRREVMWPELYVLHVRNGKESLDLEAEVAAGNVLIRTDKTNRYNIYSKKTVDLAASALTGPDIWRETQIVDYSTTNFFMSDRLRNLLHEVDMLKPWGVKKAAIKQLT